MHNIKIATRRMTTSREGPTKYEHFTSIVREDGAVHDMWMRYDPGEAHFQSTDLANFLGVELEPLVINGVTYVLADHFRDMLPRYP